MRRQFAVLTAARAIGSLLQAISFVILGRTLDIEMLGIAAAIVGLGALLAIGFDVGLQAYLSRERARGETERVVAAVGLLVVRRSDAGPFRRGCFRPRSRRRRPSCGRTLGDLAFTGEGR